MNEVFLFRRSQFNDVIAYKCVCALNYMCMHVFQYNI